MNGINILRCSVLSPNCYLHHFVLKSTKVIVYRIKIKVNEGADQKQNCQVERVGPRVRPGPNPSFRVPNQRALPEARIYRRLLRCNTHLCALIGDPNPVWFCNLNII